MDKKKTHRKKMHLKGKKKKGPSKHKKIESMSEYMNGMKHAVEDNIWDWLFVIYGVDKVSSLVDVNFPLINLSLMWIILYFINKYYYV